MEMEVEEAMVLAFLTASLVVAIMGGVVLRRWITTRVNIMLNLRNNNIPGPRPNLFTGNLTVYMSMPNVHFETWMFTKYGRICGYYLGAKRVVLVADPGLIQKMLVSNSSIFNERPRRVPGGINPDPKRAHMLGNLFYVAWKRMRGIVRLFFREKNLEKVSPSVQQLVDIFVAQVDAKIGDKDFYEYVEIDFYEHFKALTLDIIAQVGFGIHGRIQTHGGGSFMTAVQGEFSKKTSTILIIFYLCAPEVSWILYPIRRMLQAVKERFNLCPSLPLWQQGFSALRQRRLLGPLNASMDLLQYLMAARPPLSDLDIVANSVLFLEAGYETTSTSLAVLINLIARHEEVQLRLKQELIDINYDFNDPDSHLLTCRNGVLKYMDAVIFEALRMYPPQTTFIGRSPNVDFEYTDEDGRIFTIPAGCHVQVGLLEIHNSPLYWSEPEIFNPDRFMEGSPELRNMKEGKFLPFGIGPHECVGKYFAMNNLRLILSNILARYDLVAYEKTDHPTIEMDYKVATMSPKNGCFVKVSKNPIVIRGE